LPFPLLFQLFLEHFILIALEYLPLYGEEHSVFSAEILTKLPAQDSVADVVFETLVEGGSHQLVLALEVL
jgi:hypothetical protein